MIRILLMIVFLVSAQLAAKAQCPANATLQQRDGKPFCKCKDGYLIGPRLSCINQPSFTANWDTSRQSQSEKQVVHRLLQRVTNKTAANLITAYVEFKLEPADPHWQGVSASQRRVMFNDHFFEDGRSPDYQLSLLLFEAGKVLALALEAGPTSQPVKQFVSRNAVLFRALKHATVNHQGLGNLTDGDFYSEVGYAFRAFALDLNLPRQPPEGFESDEWNNLRQQWPAARRQFEAELAFLLSH